MQAHFNAGSLQGLWRRYLEKFHGFHGLELRCSITSSNNLLAGVARDTKLFANPHLSPPASSQVLNQYVQPKTSYRS